LLSATGSRFEESTAFMRVEIGSGQPPNQTIL
jgi:hypothetical protein